MAKYKLSKVAEDDLIRIYLFGCENFGTIQAEKYFNAFFDYFNLIAENPYSFESVDFIKSGYRRCVCGADSIFYRIGKDNMVEILTIIGRQDFMNI